MLSNRGSIGIAGADSKLASRMVWVSFFRSPLLPPLPHEPLGPACLPATLWGWVLTPTTTPKSSKRLLMLRSV